MNRQRRAAAVVHRYTGLVIALFLTITGLTGAVIAWNDELERVFAPSLFVLPAEAAQRPPLDPFTLREIAERETGFAVNGIDWTRRADQPAFFYVEAHPGGPEPHDDQIALDPSTGAIVGARRYGDLAQGTINLMPFLYDLHDALALGEWGAFVLGVVALLWTIDCFVGAYLTFPARRRPPGRFGAWFARWRPSWAIRWHGGRYKRFYDLHRAGGLWPWVLLLIIAWSSVAFNLPQVYRPIIAATLGAEPPYEARNADPDTPPGLGWRAAHRHVQTTMAQVATQQGFTVLSERLIFYDPGSHSYAYRVRSDRDPGVTGNTQIQIDGDTGRLLDISIPTGRIAGTTMTSWIGDIHTGDVIGLPMKVLLSLVGLCVATLSVTGVWLWWRNLRTRRSRDRSRNIIRERNVTRQA